MDLVNASLASIASIAPCKLPSPAGRSIVCSCRGIFGARASGLSSCCLRSALAATRRCFFDLAGEIGQWVFLKSKQSGKEVGKRGKGKRRNKKNIQNKSPSTLAAPSLLSAPFFFKIPHNQVGYSPSSNATGSFFPLTKFNPFNGVPAATELLTVGAAFSALGAWSSAAEGDELRGVEKGCAAPVDVAAEGV